MGSTFSTSSGGSRPLKLGTGLGFGIGCVHDPIEHAFFDIARFDAWPPHITHGPRAFRDCVSKVR